MNFNYLIESNILECESGKKMLPLLNYEFIIGLDVESSWPYCLMLRYNIRRELKVCILYLYYFLFIRDLIFFLCNSGRKCKRFRKHFFVWKKWYFIQEKRMF